MNILDITSLEDLKINSELIKKSIKKTGSIIIRGLFNETFVREVIPKIYASLDAKNLIGTTAGDRNLVRTNSIKWSVGGFTGAQIGNARLMVMAYNPLSSENLYGFHEAFKKLIVIRDIIRNDGKFTTNENLMGDSFNACRFQIYPSGGGFMLGHQDYVAEKTSNQNSASLLQLLLFITERGKDFSQGGAFLTHNGLETDIEGYAKSGDIAIYDGQSFHGVKDIDPQLPLNTEKIRGRIVALVTIYK